MPKGSFSGSGESDFRGHDFPVQAVFAFFAVATVTKFSSDGSILQIKMLQKA
jgi:hypothetical protein